MGVTPFLDRETFDELSTSTLSKLEDDQAAKTKKGALSPNSVDRMFSDFKHFFNWCLEEGHLAAMPKFSKVNGDQKRRPHFNREEWHRLLKQIPGSVQDDRQLLLHYLLNLVENGIRVDKARDLHWRDIRPINNSKDPNFPNFALTVKGKTGFREVAASGPLVGQALFRTLQIRRKDLEDEASDLFEGGCSARQLDTSKNRLFLA